jgi:hypothetical protein
MMSVGVATIWLAALIGLLVDVDHFRLQLPSFPGAQLTDAQDGLAIGPWPRHEQAQDVFALGLGGQFSRPASRDWFCLFHGLVRLIGSAQTKPTSMDS